MIITILLHIVGDRNKLEHNDIAKNICKTPTINNYIHTIRNESKPTSEYCNKTLNSFPNIF